MKPINLIIYTACIIAACLAIGYIWGCTANQPVVKPVSQDGMTGVNVKPVMVAASRLAAGVLAQIDLTFTMPAVHEWAKERSGSGQKLADTRGRVTISTQEDQQEFGGNQGYTSSGVKTFDFTSRGGGWFTTQGEIYHNPWDINIIIQQLQDGSTKVLTDEPGVTFTVKQAVAVKPKPQLKWSAEYLYGTNGTHTIIAGKDLFGWLSAKAGVEFGAGQVEGRVGGEVRF